MNRLYTVLIFIAILGMCAYVFLVVMRPQYVQRTSLLLIPQHERLTSHMDLVVNDVYMLMKKSVQGDATLAKYGAVVSVERIARTNMIEIKIYVRSVASAKVIKEHTLQTMVHDVQQYYTQDLLAMHVVERDVVPQKTLAARIMPYIVMICVGIGLIAGVFALFHYIDQLHERRKPTLSINGKKIFEKFHEITQEHRFGPQKKSVNEKHKDVHTDESVVHMKNDTHIPEKITSTEKQEQIVSVAKSTAEISIPDGISATPGNLPIVDASALGFSQSKKMQQSEHVDASTHEPTEEELKARLNALLSGKL